MSNALRKVSHAPQSIVLSFLREWLLSQSAHLPADRFSIRGVWEFSMQCQPRADERIFSEAGCLVAAYGLGASFRTSSKAVPAKRSLIGRDGRYIEVEDTALQVAILDACYSALPGRFDQEYVLTGDTVSKAPRRASIVADEVELIAGRLFVAPAKVLMIGYVDAIVEAMHHQGLRVVASDLDPDTIGRPTSAGSRVRSGHENRELIAASDIILITGLTITSSTMDDILATAHEYRKPVVIFAQTGSHFVHAYLELGVTSVISENYPWYSIPGTSPIRIRRNLEALR